MLRSKILISSFAVLFLTLSTNCLGQSKPVDSRPSAAELLPQETVAFVQVPNIQALKEDFAKTGFGRMMNDERVAPLVQNIYGQLVKLYEDNVEPEIGVSLNEILSLPTGEVCFAVVAPKRESPAFVLMIDIDESSPAVDTLIQKGRDAAEEDGAKFDTETEGEFEINIVEGNGESEFVAYVRHNNTILACTDKEVLAGILARWAGSPPEKDVTLKDNRKFMTIMNRCSSVYEDKGHQIAFFVDPFELIGSALRGEAQRKLVLGILRTAGLDGLIAIGGTSLFDEQGYESIFHLHVSLSNPRKGVFKVVALKPGQYLPEAWVPDDTTTYWTSNWDVNNVYRQIQEIYASYEPPQPWEELVQQRINDEINIDFEKDFIEALSGRITYVTWNEPPARFNSQLNVLSVGLNDPTDFRETFLAAIEQKLEDEGQLEQLDIVDYNGTEIWKAAVDEDQAERRRLRMEENNVTMDIRFPEPCMAIVGDSLIISESPQFMEHAIDTYRGDFEKLADNERYTDVMEHITRLLKTDMPSMTIYSRPDIQFRNFFELADDEGIHEFLRNQSEESEIAGGILGALEDNPLPNFDELVGYLAPSGAFFTNDDSGWHMLAFQLKADKVKEAESQGK